MLKRIILFLGILFYTLGAEALTTTDDKQWQSYFGVEGGVGVFGVSGSGVIFSGNSLFHTEHNTLGLGYSAGVLGGWQKYTSEKVGMRNTLGFSFSYIPNISSIKKGETYRENCLFNCKNAKEYDYNNRKAQHYDAYYALDGLFDFVKNGENRFGMSLGFSLNLSVGDSQGIGDSVGGVTGFFGVRIGLYSQFQNNIFDLVLKTPLGGFCASDNINGNTLTLGYKYLF